MTLLGSYIPIFFDDLFVWFLISSCKKICSSRAHFTSLSIYFVFGDNKRKGLGWGWLQRSISLRSSVVNKNPYLGPHPMRGSAFSPSLQLPTCRGTSVVTGVVWFLFRSLVSGLRIYCVTTLFLVNVITTNYMTAILCPVIPKRQYRNAGIPCLQEHARYMQLY